MNDHHVAWKDRLGLNRIWEQSIIRCLNSYGTTSFIDDVNLLRTLIINIKDGPQLRSIIDDYYNNTIMIWINNGVEEWKQKNKAESSMPELVNRTRNEFKNFYYPYFLSFIMQTLENHGFGFYKTNIFDESKSNKENIDVDNYDEDQF